ncbi:hypothetical protein VISI1226_04974 [Vibrio sinaloensis DSM 21326]|uniref:Cytochrome oxidase biogenesis cluster protein n=1 Tax=Vibrio sinaloensis DSM 21326 TaxID=945550 RepID=E8M1E9_PHOS4|nr:hypothetical protein [Vibrio sinaloensis]EGA72129.1 hypothetical protein VISI1226_04974 [Vibrio sinaloensis DSM 21326]
MTNPVLRGRIIFVALVLAFALPAIVAKTVLVNDWYQSGVTNRGVLIEPAVTFESLGLTNPHQGEQWQLAYVVPKECNEFCQQQIHLLGQSHLALGKYQNRVSPVLITTNVNSPVMERAGFPVLSVDEQFHNVVHDFEYVIVDPLGQLVMRYPKVASAELLVGQSKDVLADLRKLLKLSRVG